MRRLAAGRLPANQAMNPARGDGSRAGGVGGDRVHARLLRGPGVRRDDEQVRRALPATRRRRPLRPRRTPRPPSRRRCDRASGERNSGGLRQSTTQTLPRSCTTDSGSTYTFSWEGPVIATSTNVPGNGSESEGEPSWKRRKSDARRVFGATTEETRTTSAGQVLPPARTSADRPITGARCSRTFVSTGASTSSASGGYTTPSLDDGPTSSAGPTSSPTATSERTTRTSYGREMLVRSSCKPGLLEDDLRLHRGRFRKLEGLRVLLSSRPLHLPDGLPPPGAPARLPPPRARSRPDRSG